MVRRRFRSIVLLVPLLVAGCDGARLREILGPHGHLKPNASVSERLTELRPTVSARLEPYFRDAGAAYPPAKAELVFVKDRRELELYAPDSANQWRFVKRYRVLAASGHAGPKLREGDNQVPEGIYDIDSLNPNSRFHVALHVAYPNAFDREKARVDGRSRLGGDIMIHGNAVSIGCIAVGDAAAEELFVIAASAGPHRVELLSTPFDTREPGGDGRIARLKFTMPWVSELYRRIGARLKEFPKSSSLS